jgi:hypothetical protein
VNKSISNVHETIPLTFVVLNSFLNIKKINGTFSKKVNKLGIA